MCDKAVNTHPSTKNLFLNALTQKMCDKAVKCFFCISFYSCKTQKMCDTVASNDPSTKVYYPDNI